MKFRPVPEDVDDLVHRAHIFLRRLTGTRAESVRTNSVNFKPVATDCFAFMLLFNVQGLISPNFVRQAKSRRHRAFGKKFVGQFHQHSASKFPFMR